MKRIIFSIALLFVVLSSKAQHIELDYPPGSPSISSYCTVPTVWLDGDSVRFSFNVTFPPSSIVLAGNVDVWLRCGEGPYSYDLSWTNATRPSDTERTYSGARYIADLTDGSGWDIDYGVQFDTVDEALGVNSLISFRYYSY